MVISGEGGGGGAWNTLPHVQAPEVGMSVVAILPFCSLYELTTVSYLEFLTMF